MPKDKAYYRQLLANPNIKATLDTIAKAEGVKYGYQTLYGNTKFQSLDKHPKILVTKWGITSSAAGRYQILYKTWENISKRLSLESFSPENQDIAALYLIDEKKAIPDILAGNALSAFNKIKKLWASLPGAGYGQGERSPEFIAKWYNYFLKNSPKTGSILPLLLVIGAVVLMARK